MAYAPFFWKQKDAWFINYDKPDGGVGRKKLGKSKREAMDNWKRMTDLSGNPLVIQVADRWVTFLEDRLKNGQITQSHFTSAYACLKDFVDKRTRWSNFTPAMVTSYCAKKGWRPDTTRTRMTHLKSLSLFGSTHLGLSDALSHLKKPSKQRREKVVSADEYQKIIEYVYRNRRQSDHRIAYIITALWHTGARTGELMQAKRSQLAGDQIIQMRHKRDKKISKPRVIYLNLPAKIACGMCDGHNEYLFCNARGEPWNKDSFGSRLKHIVREAGLDEEIVGYSFRHAYATRALVKGVDINMLAELMGTSVSMISAHYGHLSKRSDVLRAAALSF